MPSRSVGIDRRRLGSGDGKMGLRPTTAPGTRGITGVPKAKAASNPSRKSSFDRLAAPKIGTTRQKYNPSSKLSTLKTRANPMSTRSSSGTTASHIRSNGHGSRRKPALSDNKENQRKVTTAETKKSTMRAPASTSLHTPRHSNVAASTTRQVTSNKKVTFTAATKPPAVVPTAAARADHRGSGINSLRRSLRETITPPSQKGRKSKLPSSSSESALSDLFPEQHGSQPKQVEAQVAEAASTPFTSAYNEPPKTPNSILKEQLDITLDESLLVSPSLNSFENLNGYLQESRVSPLEVHIQSTDDPRSKASEQAHRTSIVEPTIDPTRVTNNSVAGRQSQNLAPPRPPGIVSEDSVQREGTLSMKGSLFSGTRRKDARSIVKSSQTPARHVHAQSLEAAKEKTLPYETPCMVHNAAKTLSVANFVDTPNSKREKGVCLDLTALFFNEQKTVRKCNRKDAQPPNQNLSKESRAENKQPTMPIDKNKGNTSQAVPTDEQWAEMQCETFSKWLNFTLDPAEESHDRNQPADGDTMPQGEKTTVDSDRHALRTLLLHQQIAKTRSSASDLFHGYEMKRICGAIDAELEKGKLAIRSDRDLHSDLGYRKKITKLLLSYSTPWLRLGLETLFGEIILPEVPSQYSPTKRSLEKSSKIAANQVRVALRQFIVDRVLFDAAVLKKYTKGRCKVPSGNFEKRYRAEMRSLVLRRLLTLVFFLDRAKQANLLDKAPRLFLKACPVKSSRDVLIAFCRDFLASEGDITKHLGRVGLKVSYTQQAIDEIDMKIDNFAVDLRDGIRLTKIVEILTRADANTLLRSLRIPAVSRLQKLHNVGVSLEALRDTGVGITADISPHHIVDGHRSMVLTLMWSVISHYCFPAVLDFDQVEEEIQNLRDEHERRRQSGTNMPAFDIEDESCAAADVENKGKAIILRWCRAVCSLFGIGISDFSESFADGKALCFLVHYYHPRMLPISEIRPTTRDLAVKQSLSVDRARYNEKLNSSLAHMRMSELGGIPTMMPATDTTVVPDEKSLLVYLCYACSRLMASRQEVQAIEKIQCVYRAYNRRRQWAKQIRAAAIILHIWRGRKEQFYLNQRKRYAGAVSKIEMFVWSRRHILRRLEIQRLTNELAEYAALKVQSQIRFFLAKKRVIMLRNKNKAALNLQRTFRQRQACRRVEQLRLVTSAATKCQRLWRGYASRQQTLITLSSIILVQAIARSKITRRRFHVSRKASACIQRIWRGFSVQLQYQMDLMDIVAVQGAVRRRLAIKQRELRLRSALVMQMAVRGYLARCILNRKRRAADALKRGHESATVCQRYVRKFLATRRTAVLRLQTVAATVIQREWREYRVRCLLQRRKLAAVWIQSFARTAKASNDFNTKRLSAILIQKQTRFWLARRVFASQKNAISTLQRFTRCWLAKRMASRRRHFIINVVLCQSIVRQFLAQKRLKYMNEAATVIQSTWRGLQQRCFFKTTQHLALSCQALWRGRHTRKETSEMQSSAVIIQKVYRRHRTIRQLEALQFNVVRMQAWWRSMQQMMRRRFTMTGIVKAEALVRGYLSRRKLQQKSTLSKALLVSIEFSFSVSHAARFIQKIWRARFHLKRFRRTRVLALFLTALARGKLARLRQSAQERSAVKIQSAYRRHEAIQTRSLSLVAVVRLQNAWRTYLNVNAYQDMKNSASQIQQVVRAWMFRSKARQQFYLKAVQFSLLKRSVGISESTRKAAMCVQSFWRSHMARQVYIDVKARIVCLQAASRRFLTSKRCERLKDGITLFQRQIRARSSKREFTAARNGMVLVQARFRGVMVRRRQRQLLENAVSIQSSWRRFIALQSYQRMLGGVLILQSLARRNHARQTFCVQRKAVAQIQHVARSWIARRALTELRTKRAYTQEAAALALQSHYRGYRVRVQLHSLRSSALIIQRMWRGFACFVDYHMDLNDIAIVQSIARGWLARRQAEERLAAIIRVQSVARTLCANREALAERKRQQEFIRVNTSALCIQRVVRGGLAREETKKHAAARFIQKIWRAYNVHVDFLCLLLGTVTIQTHIRMRLAKNRFSLQKKAALVIQQHWSLFVFRRERLRNQASIEIQRIFRGFVKCFQFEIKLFSALRIQQVTRTYLARNAVQERRRQVEAERRRLRMPRAATTIQINVRNFLARKTFARLVRRISDFQGLVRGHRVRRRRKKRVRITAARLKQACLRATKTPNLRLGARTLIALNVLQTSRSLAEIMTALQTLEFSTRFSKACCEAFAHAKATDILLSTIRQCNRSRPHTQLLIYIVRTLRNVAQHDSLLTYIATVTACEVILDLVQSFRDKQEIFCTAVSLVERCIVFDDEVEDLCKTHENRKRIKGVYNLCNRKAAASCNLDMNEGVAALRRIIAHIEASKQK